MILVTLEPEFCYRVLESRDARFDGLFFVGVSSTGVYCRCVCPARTPLQKNCRFFHSPAEAEVAGFRPCLRCRPETAPGRSSVDAVRSRARKAARLIETGGLDGINLDAFAAQLGISERQLRRAMKEELGVAPAELAQTHRLLNAKRLLTDTRLPVGEVAMASGYSSLRRFNATFRERYGLTPTDLRKRARTASQNVVCCELFYRPPFDWDFLVRFLGNRRIAGVETIDEAGYARTVSIGGRTGCVRVTHRAERNSLAVQVSETLSPVLPKILDRVRRLFDLDADPAAISAVLGELAAPHPGTRLPGAFDGFEAVVRAILGQQVSVSFATILAGRFAEAFGTPLERMTPHRVAGGSDYCGCAPEVPLSRFADSPTSLAEERGTAGEMTKLPASVDCSAASTRPNAMERLHCGSGELRYVFPTPEALAERTQDDVAKLGIIGSRARAILAVARELSEKRLQLNPAADYDATKEALLAIPGLGPWTAEYVSMRALSYPDAFPAGDLGVLKALGTRSQAEAIRSVEAYRPWRAYAAIHLWRSLEPARTVS